MCAQSLKWCLALSRCPVKVVGVSQWYRIPEMGGNEFWKNSLLLAFFTLMVLPHSTLLTPNVSSFSPPSHSLWHQLGVIQLIQFWCSLPGDNVRSHRLRSQSHKTVPTPLQMPVASPGCHLWWMACKSEIPIAPCSQFARVAHRPQRKHFYLSGS